MNSSFAPLPFARGTVQATSLALREYPSLNAHVNAECTEVIQRAAHNIGVAMDTPKGLIVPNVKNVQNLTLFEIAAELNRMQELASAGRLGEADLKDGTFTYALACAGAECSVTGVTLARSRIIATSTCVDRAVLSFLSFFLSIYPCCLQALQHWSDRWHLRLPGAVCAASCDRCPRENPNLANFRR